MILDRAARDDSQRKPAETIAACMQVALWHGRYDLASAGAARLLREETPPRDVESAAAFSPASPTAGSRSPTKQPALRR